MADRPFEHLEGLRSRAIPDQAPVRALKEGYRTHALDLDAPHNSEPLEPAAKFDLWGVNFYHLERNPPYYRRIAGSVDFLMVRAGVGERLHAVQQRLLKDGLRLWLFDAWRPTAVQRYFHETWMPAEVRRLHPDWSEAAIAEGAARYWAAPSDDPRSPSPHLTGGALDLTLCWADSGEKLWMGSLFDDVSELAHLDRFEPQVAPPSYSYSDAEARANRRLLYWVMIEGGFCANPAEWWHFSHGDQMWARLTGAPVAVYGAAKP